VTRQTVESVMNSVKRKCCVGEGDNAEKITFVAVKSDVKKRCYSPNDKSCRFLVRLNPDCLIRMN